MFKYGWNNFKIGILERIDLSNLNTMDDIKLILERKEKYYISIINPSLNIRKVGGSPLDIKKIFLRKSCYG